MNLVKVKKARLLEALTENRKKHRDSFLKAQDGFRREVVEQLDAALKDAHVGKRFRTTFSLPAPVDQTREYDVAIEMLGWEVDEEITLYAEDFRKYILDDWDWKQHWMTSNTAYMAKSVH